MISFAGQGRGRAKLLGSGFEVLNDAFEELADAFTELTEIMDNIWDAPEFPPKYIRNKSKISRNICPKYLYIPKFLKNLPYQRRVYY